MKNLILFALTLLFFSCEMQLLENLEEMPETIENTQGTYQITPVSVATIQSLGKRLSKKSGFNVIESAQMRQLSDFTFDLGASQLTTDTLKRRTYSIPFLEKGDNYSTFNLVIVADSLDNIKEQYVLQYDFDQISFQIFEETSDLVASGVTIKRFPFSSFFNDSNQRFLERCDGIFDTNGDPVSCDQVTLSYGSGYGGGASGGNTIWITPGGGGTPAATSGGGSSGSGLNDQGSPCTWSVVTVAVPNCGGDYCQGPNSFDIIEIVCFNPFARKGTTANQSASTCLDCSITDFGAPPFTLTRDATQIDHLLTNYSLSQWHMAYLSNNISFTNDLRSSMLSDPNLDQKAAIFTINAGMNGALSGNFNRAFMLSVEGLLPESDADYTQDPIQILFQSYFLPRYLMLKNLNPTWSSTKLFYETSKDALHLSLDGIGLIEGIGTPADLINAGLYYLEGDNLSGNLSLVAATPVIGLFSTTIKGAIKLKGIIPGTSIRITHVWAKNGNTILFGGTNLRKVMGLTDPSKHAHHILPLEHAGHPVIQKAAKAKNNPFHLQEIDNGVAVPAWQNTTHPAYNTKIRGVLDRWNSRNPNATPEQAMVFLQEKMQELSQLIANNPSVKINDLIFE
jgi:hypothetical protein